MAAQVCADSCPATTETDNDNMFLTPARPHTPTANALNSVITENKVSLANTAADAGTSFTGAPCSVLFSNRHSAMHAPDASPLSLTACGAQLELMLASGAQRLRAKTCPP